MWYLQQFVNIVNNFTTFSKETTLKLSRLTKTISDNRCTTIAVVPYTDNYSKLNFLLRHCKCRPAEFIMFTLSVMSWTSWQETAFEYFDQNQWQNVFFLLSINLISSIWILKIFISFHLEVMNDIYISFFNPALRCYNKFILFLIETNTCVYSSFSRVIESPKGNHLL